MAAMPDLTLFCDEATLAHIAELKALLLRARPAVQFFVDHHERLVTRTKGHPAYCGVVDQQVQQLHDVLLAIDEIMDGHKS